MPGLILRNIYIACSKLWQRSCMLAWMMCATTMPKHASNARVASRIDPRMHFFPCNIITMTRQSTSLYRAWPLRPSSFSVRLCPPLPWSGGRGAWEVVTATMIQRRRGRRLSRPCFPQPPLPLPSHQPPRPPHPSTMPTPEQTYDDDNNSGCSG
jgi:hypothetical protein